MRLNWLVSSGACAVVLLAYLGGKAQPVTTRPAGFVIQGTVKASSTLDLQKPDLSRVVVYLASNPALDTAKPLEGHATVAQKNKAFVPNFLIVQVGTDVEFPNWDNFDHNVFSFSKAAPAFDLDRYPKGQSKSRIFEKVGVVQTFCNIHPDMHAVIVVTPNSFFTHADSAGKFVITGVPAGHYDLVAWQERCGERRQPVDVKDGAMPEISFTLAENRQNILPDDAPARGNSYGVERGLGVKREQLNLPVVKDAHPALDPE